MASDVTVPNNFTAGTPAVADDVDANFAAVTSWVNTNAVHLDASKAFTGIPVGPASDPTSDNQLARKAYVDSKLRGFTNAPSTRTTQLTGVTTTATDTGMTLTVTPIAGRRYRFLATGMIFSSVTGDLAQVRITDSIGTIQSLTVTSCIANFGVGYAVQYIWSPVSATPTTFKVQVIRGNGTGSITLDGNASYPAYFTCEDMGV